MREKEHKQGGEQMGRRSRLLSEQEPGCGASSQDPGIMTWAEGRPLPNWATQAPQSVLVFKFSDSKLRKKFLEFILWFTPCPPIHIASHQVSVRMMVEGDVGWMGSSVTLMHSLLFWLALESPAPGLFVTWDHKFLKKKLFIVWGSFSWVYLWFATQSISIHLPLLILHEVIFILIEDWLLWVFDLFLTRTNTKATGLHRSSTQQKTDKKQKFILESEMYLPHLLHLFCWTPGG